MNWPELLYHILSYFFLPPYSFEYDLCMSCHL